ncbi:MAG: HAD-IIA family hydrolase [Chloroflexi bacterium]|nr:HAD-IIA family hydrolase [Chloroflexota bacterium]
MDSIAAIILAAGASARFGRPKHLLDWDGRPLIAHVTDTALSAGLSPVVVVLGHQGRKGLAVLGNRPIRAVTNWRWQQGISTSVQTGLAALSPDTRAALFLQCDQPLVTRDLVQALVARFDETQAPIVCPTYDGEYRSPVLFAARLFAELADIRGDVGGKAVMRRHPDEIATVQVSDPSVLADVDTPAEYDALRARAAAANLQAPRLPSGILNCTRHLIIDMDGVLWQGDAPLPGLQEFFAFLHQRKITYILATNNSSRTPDQYAAKLAQFGVDILPDHILTSSEATATYLETIAPVGARVYPVGEEGVRHALIRHGFTVCEADAEYVVVGWDRQLTWDELAAASLMIHNGAAFIGTNPDTSFPTEHGPVPGNGAQLAAIEITTGVRPIIIGKPEPWMYQEAMRRMGASTTGTAVIGDRLDTDIAGGVRLGLTTILVLSGIAQEADLIGSKVRPDLVVPDIRTLVQSWPSSTDKEIGD